jgi:hypothetical protein
MSDSPRACAANWAFDREPSLGARPCVGTPWPGTESPPSTVVVYAEVDVAWLDDVTSSAVSDASSTLSLRLSMLTASSSSSSSSDTALPIRN